MVVNIPKKRHLKRTLSVVGVSLLLGVMVIACYSTGTKLTALSNFVGTGAEQLEGDKSAIVPRSVSLFDYQKVVWSDDSNTGTVQDKEEDGMTIEVLGGYENEDRDQVVKRSSPLNSLNDFEYVLNNINGKRCFSVILRANL